MSSPEQGAFFATQVNLQQDQSPAQIENQLTEQLQIQMPSKQQESQHGQQQQLQQPDQFPSQEEEQVELKKLLELFNSYDKSERGTINLNHCQQIIWTFSHITKPSKQQIQVYYKLSQPSNVDLITFDEFLFIFGLCQFSIETQSIDDQYEYCKRADPRVIDFLRLLNNYRKKCEKQSIYQEAKKSKQKVQLVRQSEYQRRKNFLNLIHKRQLEGLEQKQKEKFVQFCQTWDEFRNQYEQTAAELVKRLGEKQDQELREFIERTREQLASKIRFSKKIVQLQDFERKLVKSQEYEKADKVKAEIEQLKIFELQKKQKQDMSVVQLRAQTLRKQHLSAMNTLLQKIQKDRNDQSKQRMSDSQKLIVKSKTLVTQVKHRHTESLKKLYEALHNVSIDDARIMANIQTGSRAKSTFGQVIKQRG